jgi:GTPase SAR1 family protein
LEPYIEFEQFLYPPIFQHASKDVVKMLLGNKCDMTDRRVVPKERGEQMAINHQMRFLETSSKANINIDKSFYDLAEAILDKTSSSGDSGGLNVGQGASAFDINNRCGYCNMI